MKKVVSLLLCAVMLIGLLPVSALAANTNELTITADKTEATAGDEIKFTISIDVVETCESLGMILEFDRDVFEFVSGKIDRNFAYDEDENQLANIANFAATAGKEGIAISFDQTYAPIAFSGKVGTFTLKVKEGASFTTASVTGRTSTDAASGVLNVNTVEITNSNPTVETTAATEATEHVHTWVEYAAVEPTCDMDGNIAYKQCSECGEAWSLGENPMPLGRYQWVLGNLGGHTWVDYAAVEPTCHTDGNIAYQQCSVCGAAQTAGENPMPLGKFGWVLTATHTGLVHYDAVEATCDTDGHEAFDYCEDCQVFIYADPLKLSYQDGIIPALGHTWVDHEAVAPSCNAEGNIAYQQCSVCGAAQTAGENPMPLGRYQWVLGPTGEHTFEHHDAIAPTCDQNGHEAFDYCTTCECFFYADPMKLTYQAGIILPLGHTWTDIAAVAPTCHADGNIAYQLCSVCGAAQTAGENPMPLSKFGWVLAAEHTGLVHYEAIKVTCDTDGHEAYDYCEDCQVFIYEDPLKLSYQDGVIPATGHNAIEHIEAQAATCHGRGVVEHWVCADCGATWLDEEMTKVSNQMSIYLPELGSEKLEHVEAKAATTEAEGNVEYWYCPECEAYFLDEACTQLTNALRVVTPKLEAEDKEETKPEEETKPVEKPEQKPEADNDKTGDATPVVALIVLAVLAVFGMALVVTNKKRFVA